MIESEEREFILIVDDVTTNLSVLSKLLKSAGFKFRVAIDGESAIELVKYDRPAMILLDVQMPGIDGFETCQLLKANPQTQDIPVIFMTGMSNPQDKVKGLSLGAVDYITKPFESEEVLARVRVHLKLHSLTETLERQNQQLSATLKQLKAAQKQIIAQEKLASLGALTAGVAHELRNPLNFVQNYAEGSVELIEEVIAAIANQSQPWSAETFDEIKYILNEVRENSVAINQQSQRASNIIGSMMQHARTDSGQARPTDLNALLAQALQLAYHSRRASQQNINIKISTNYDRSISPLSLVSADLLRAFINIIENACYAVGAKQKQVLSAFTPHLWLETINQGEEVEIRIRDNGIGIAPDICDRIFNPFFTTKPTGEGTGLGLSLTHDIIVGQHRGNIQVESKLGEMTEFILTLPTNTAET